MTAPPQVSRPRLVAFDTSHLATLAQDFTSSVRERRKLAQEFLSFLASNGWLPLICWHQVEELLQHRNERLVDHRVRFLQSLQVVAWIAPSDEQAGLGTVVDILRAEVKAAFEDPTAGLNAVRDRARERLLRAGAGGEAFQHLQGWRELRSVLRAREARARELVAISRSKFIDIDKTRVADWMKLPLRTTAESDRQLRRLQAALANDIATRGDKRILDPATVSRSFVDDITRRGGLLVDDEAHPALAILLAQGLDMEDIGPETTMAEIGDLLTFRQRLRLAAEPLCASWPDIKRIVTMDRLPVTLIENAMRQHAQDNPERKGSDLTDVHLLCLSPYANVTYVDKRTHENLLRAKRKSPALTRLTGIVSKASDYREIEQELKQLDP